MLISNGACIPGERTGRGGSIIIRRFVHFSRSEPLRRGTANSSSSSFTRFICSLPGLLLILLLLLRLRLLWFRGVVCTGMVIKLDTLRQQKKKMYPFLLRYRAATLPSVCGLDAEVKLV